jgi:hypothetical protein
MHNSSKYISVLFAILITVNGISRSYYYELVNQTNNYGENSEHHFFFSQENINSSYFLHRLNEKTNILSNNLPSCNARIFSNYNEYFTSLELCFSNTLNQYFSNSEIIDKSLSIQVIIFPFHTFG